MIDRIGIAATIDGHALDAGEVGHKAGHVIRAEGSDTVVVGLREDGQVKTSPVIPDEGRRQRLPDGAKGLFGRKKALIGQGGCPIRREKRLAVGQKGGAEGETSRQQEVEGYFHKTGF